MSFVSDSRHYFYHLERLNENELVALEATICTCWLTDSTTQTALHYIAFTFVMTTSSMEYNNYSYYYILRMMK